MDLSDYSSTVKGWYRLDLNFDFICGNNEEMLVDWGERFFALENCIDVPHCQLFESHVSNTVSIAIL